MIDVKPTAAMIEEMANTLRHYALELDDIKERMIRKNDISYTGEALQVISFGNLRIDLLATRPIREFEREKR